MRLACSVSARAITTASAPVLHHTSRKEGERTGDRVADDVLKEDLENTARLLVDEARDALHSSTTSETADRGLGDALNVVPKLWCGPMLAVVRWMRGEAEGWTHDLAVALRSALAESLAAFSSSGHVDEGGLVGWGWGEWSGWREEKERGRGV